jgi:hypothetical protein
MQTPSTANADSVIRALIARYVKTEAEKPDIDHAGVVALLRTIPDQALIGNAPIVSVLAIQSPDSVIAAADRAVLLSIDDCLKMIFSLATVEGEIGQQLRLSIPALAAALMARPDLPMQATPSVLSVLDHVVTGTLGWTASLGRAGEKVYDLTREVISQLRSGDADMSQLQALIVDFLTKETGRTERLEERLIATETGQLRSQQSKVIAATMVNKASAGKVLTRNIVNFLHGPWFDSIQLIILTKGIDSEEWFRATKMTETIVWTYQPINSEDQSVVSQEKQRLYRIIEHLPGEIRQLLVALEHNSDGVETALDTIDSDHMLIVSGQSLDYTEFDPIPNDTEVSSRSKVSRMLQRKVNAFEPGQWFTHHAEGRSIRIKLVLKLPDVKQLLFTNRSGVKVLQTGFDDFAYLLSSGVVKPLYGEAVFTSTFRTYYEGLVEENSRQLRRSAEKRAETDREEQEQEAAKKAAIAAAAALTRAREDEAREREDRIKREHLEHARQALETADPKVIAAITASVSELAVGAWLKLTRPSGQVEECKLAVKISSSDKLIFVSRSGMKVGEYSSQQLVQLLVAGQGEIQDEGVEFEDTLAQVVARLRQDRTKSYDDLTGE